MTIELIIDPLEKVSLKEDLLLNKLHKHHIVCLEIEEKTCNYTIKSVKKVVFCGIKNDQEIFTISHLTTDKYFQFHDILNYSKNRDFIEKQIITKVLNLEKWDIKKDQFNSSFINPIRPNYKSQIKYIDY